MAEAAVALSLRAAAGAEPGGAAYGVRVGVDGALAGDTGPVAEAVAAAVAAAGRPVARVSREDFLRPRSVRLELGGDDPDAGWERWYDDGALRREVLDPLGPDAAAGPIVAAWAGPGEPEAPRSQPAGPGPMTWLPSLWDEAADRATRAARRSAAPGTVAVVAGPYLLRWELADAFDLVVHLAVGPAALARRCPPADLARVEGSWRRYVEETEPAARAAYVVRLEDPRHPALVTP